MYVVELMNYVVSIATWFCQLSVAILVFKMAAPKMAALSISTFAIISGHDRAIESRLILKYMFLGARTQIVSIAIWITLCISRHIEFQNGRHLKSIFANSSSHNAAIDLVLVYKRFFRGDESNIIKGNLE